MKIPLSSRSSFLRGCVLLMVSAPAIPGVFADGFGDGTARVVAGFVQSLKYDNSGAAVVGISAGAKLGKNDSGELSFEWLAGRWKTLRYDRFDNCIDTTRELHMPVMVNYRHYLRMPRIPVALYAGAGAGLHMITNSFSPEFYKIDYDPETGEANGWYEFFKRFDYAVTAAGTVGVAINLSSRAGIDIGVRWAWQSGSSHAFENDTGAKMPRGDTVRTRQEYTRMFTVSAHWTH